MDKLADDVLALRRRAASRPAPTRSSSSTRGPARSRSADYREFAAPYSARILAAVDAPTIHFATGDAHLLDDLAAAGGDVIGLDWRVPLDVALGARRPRPRHPGKPRSGAVLLGRWQRIERRRRHSRRGRGPAGHIFNLGHGVLPETDPDILGRLVELVHERTRRRCPREDGGQCDGVRQPFLARGRSPPTSRTCAAAGPSRTRRSPSSPSATGASAARSPLTRSPSRSGRRSSASSAFPVFVGMKHWPPWISEAVEQALAGGADAASSALVLAPHYSRHVDRRVPRAARGGLHGARPSSCSSRAGTTTRPFVDVLAEPRARNRRPGRLHGALPARADPRRRRPVPRPAARDVAPGRRARRRSSAGRSPSRARARPASRGSARTSSTSSTGCTRRRRARCSSRRSASSPTTSRSSGTSTSRRATRATSSGCELERIDVARTTTRPSSARSRASSQEGSPCPDEALRELPELPRLADADGVRARPAVQALHGRRGEAALRGARRTARHPDEAVAICADLDHNVFNPRTPTRRSPRRCARRTGTSCASGRPAAPARTR